MSEPSGDSDQTVPPFQNLRGSPGGMETATCVVAVLLGSSCIAAHQETTDQAPVPCR